MTGSTRSSNPHSLAALFRQFSSSSSSASSSVQNLPSLPPKPAIDYNRIISNRNSYAKNLIDRKSHLTPDAIEDVAYLHAEFKNLSKKLIEARHRQNLLGNKIKEAIASVSQTAKDPSSDQENNHHLLLDSGSLSKSKTSTTELLQSSNLDLATKVQDYHTEAATLKNAISTLSKDGITLELRLLNLATQLPNDIHPSVPIGSYENSVIASSSSFVVDPLPFKSFQDPCRPPDPSRDHLKLMSELGWLSFASGQKTTGPSFPFLTGNGAFLELAITNYAISRAVRSGWKFTTCPEIVRSELSDRCGFSPRDGGESNHTYFVSTHRTNHQNSRSSEPTSTAEATEEPTIPELCLAATAEIPLVGAYHSITLPNKEYPSFPIEPIQLVSLGTAFRAEAGSRGSESRGLYRVHQFKKVELMAITDGEAQTSEKMLQKMLALQIQIVEGLNLSYRVLEMSTEELGASAHHKYDIEVWMPGRGRWGEVSSASNCTDYQARRLGIRARVRQPSSRPVSEADKPEEEESEARKQAVSPAHKRPNEKASFVHTLNATAAAMPRLIVGLVENGAHLDAHNQLVAVNLPLALKPYWLGNDEKINWVASTPPSQ